MLMVKTGNNKLYGFTLLEVMVAMVIMATALIAVFGSQSQSVSLAGEASFNITAPLLAQMKMAEIEVNQQEDPGPGSGDFGEEFPGYVWQLSVRDVQLDTSHEVSDHLKRIDLKVSRGEDGPYQYHLRMYQFFPKTP